jgi:hypothetical protein
MMHYSPKLHAVVFAVNLTSSACLAFSSNATLSALPSNTAADLGLYTTHCADSTGDPDNCGRYGDYSRFTYDPEHHQILFFGGGHATTMRDDIDVFNFQNLSWESAYKSTLCNQMTTIASDGSWSSTGHPVARHTYDQLIYAPNAHGLFITSPVYGAGYCGTYGGCGEWCAGKMFLYNPDTKTWTAKTTATNSAHVWSSEYDPVSGKIVSAGGGGLNVYDPVADSKTTPVSSSQISGYADNLVYYPPTDRFYYMARGNPVKVYEVTLDRASWNKSTITEITGMTGTPRTDETGWAYDTANKIIGGGVTNGIFYAFDPVLKSWTSQTAQKQGGGSASFTCYSHCLDYDPVDQVFIMLGTDFHTWAYCYSRTTATTVTHPERIENHSIKITAGTRPGDIRVQLGTPTQLSLIHMELFNALGESRRISVRADCREYVIQTNQRLRRGAYFLRVDIGKNVIVRKVMLL